LTLTYYLDGFNNLWEIYDNLFDGATISLSGTGTTNYINHAYNGFTAGTSNPFGSGNITGLQPDYQSGPLGNYYYPTNGTNLFMLINAGIQTADLAGLYHYTTTTNQVKETNSVVDIGFHYVAVNTNGLPFDTDGDTRPDYLEDVNGNGNGSDDPTSWLIYNSPNGLTGATGLQVFTPLK
jgi:hypothetical protein